MPLFGGLRKSKEKNPKRQETSIPVGPPKPNWTDAWLRPEVSVDEVAELIHTTTDVLRRKGVDKPFWLLPFRLDDNITTQNSAKLFIRNFSQARFDHTSEFTGEGLRRDLELRDITFLAIVLRWSWSRIPGGVVSWDVYHLFCQGENDSDQARHAFDSLLPVAVEAEPARQSIIYDFFELMGAIATNGRTNGFPGKRISRLMGYWAFEIEDAGAENGFDNGYKNWAKAANATMHMFFAWMRSKDDPTLGTMSHLPRGLQSLSRSSEYPPQIPSLMLLTTYKVLMIVDQVSPTPYSLLRRTKNFEYRDDMEPLQDFSTFDDPINALTDECRRVLNYISSVNQTTAPGSAGGGGDGSWNRFEEIGFDDFDIVKPTTSASRTTRNTTGRPLPRTQRGLDELRQGASTGYDEDGRPKTPSWGDFLSRGFVDDGKSDAPTLLPPEMQLPQVGMRAHSSQSHIKHEDLSPGELASITSFDLDDTFWFVWMTSLADEETPKRKAIFGRCCLIETEVPGARWLVVEEQVQGASPGPEEGAYIAEKKSKFSFTRRGKTKKTTKKEKQDRDPYSNGNGEREGPISPASKTSIGPAQQHKVHAAAMALARQEKNHNFDAARRGRKDDQASMKTNSVLTLQPAVASEAGPAMKWAREFDKDTVRAQYLGNKIAGTGKHVDILPTSPTSLDDGTNGSVKQPTTNGNASSRHLPTSPSTPSIQRKELPASPGKLPVSPGKASDSSRNLDTAAQAPLPAGVSLDEKPSSTHTKEQPNLDQHPALRKRTSSDEAAAAAPPPPPKPESPELQKTVTKDKKPKKLEKEKKKEKSGGGAFKKLFSRKKDKARSNTPQPADDALRAPSVATQRSDAPSAALEPPAGRPSFQAPAAPQTSNETEPAHAPAPVPYGDGNHADDEDEDAAREFHKFDQGPLHDMPDAVPEESESESAKLYQQPRKSFAQGRHDEDPISPVDPGERTEDDISEASVDLSRQHSPADRWAQIRKNAADRAARMSEDRSMRSRRSTNAQTEQTDDGDTSGEETIENRVARIKARVAELTGQMDSSGNIQTASSPRG